MNEVTQMRFLKYQLPWAEIWSTWVQTKILSQDSTDHKDLKVFYQWVW